MKAKPKSKIVNAWIVVIRCNLYDVICGCWPTVGMARAQMRAVLKDPDSINDENPMNVSLGGSGLIGVAIYRVTKGASVKFYEQKEFDELEEAA